MALLSRKSTQIRGTSGKWFICALAPAKHALKDCVLFVREAQVDLYVAGRFLGCFLEQTVSLTVGDMKCLGSCTIITSNSPFDLQIAPNSALVSYAISFLELPNPGLPLLILYISELVLTFYKFCGNHI